VSESPVPIPGGSEAGDGNDRRRSLLILGGVLGTALVLGGGFLLLHGGGGSTGSAGGLVSSSHNHVRSGSAASPSTSGSPQAELKTFHGSIGHDPFEAPARIAAALLPAANASAAPGPGAPASGVPTAVTPATGATVTVPTTSSSASPTAQPTAPQWIQLLAAHHQSDDSWTVDVRTATGTVKNVKTGATKIGGTYFAYEGADEQLGSRTFVFIAGDDAGGNLRPNKSVKPFSGALTSANRTATLVLKNGSVDGGLY
jgi:hypothetical protein